MNQSFLLTPGVLGNVIGLNASMGEILGWSIIAFAVAAGLLFPLRKWGRPVLRRIVGKTKAAKAYRNSQKIHIPFGILAVVAAVSHGTIMYIIEGELTGREWVGLTGVIAILLAIVLGAKISQKRDKTKKQVHMAIFTTAAVLIVTHIGMTP
ncbi:hypothetical protein D1970_09570 [Mesobacillus zeae]|uniref:Uncharacterized protein n=2 Tax=Mesobacillus zeae TaxID=1917180 RepID=A0A398BDX3_9BACI|nr:hypothetical protein D1970_09570 [Mesobacillus zeae]